MTFVAASANPSTIQDKFMVGYQGWFTCAGDGPPLPGHHGWLHWVNQPLPQNGRPNTDLWPDTSAYDASELYAVEGLAHKDGSPAKVFSSRDPRTVRRHWRWMAEHGVDGGFLQRFAGMVDAEEEGNRSGKGTLQLRDEVGKRVREAAEAENRVWAIMYDVSGVPVDKIQRILTQDFTHLLHDERILASPAYLHERGRPVVALWGFGLSDSPVPPDLVREIIAGLRLIYRSFTSPDQDLYIFAGVPSHWRQPGQGDCSPDPRWSHIWLGPNGCVDALSPWSVGRYSNADEVERWAADRWGPDAELVASHNSGIVDLGKSGRKVDYVPVVLPGGSGFNLSEGKWGIFHAKRLKGVRVFYGAMWDEYDEGTAFLPVVSKAKQLPESERWPFLALDEDGFDLPSDWYMRIAGFAAEGLRSERRVHDTFPNKELQDYWGTRPRYEEDAPAPAAAASSSASSSSAPAPLNFPSAAERERQRELAREREREAAAREAKAQFDAWSEEQARKEREKEEMPPPAYSLEDDQPQPAAVSVQTPAQAPVVASVQYASPQQQQTALPPQSPPASQASFQEQQYTPQQYQSPHNTVDGLTNDFSRTTLGSAPPPLPDRRESSASVSLLQQNSRLERPPLHPSHPHAGRTSSGGSGTLPPPPQHPSMGRTSSGSSSGSGYSPNMGAASSSHVYTGPTQQPVSGYQGQPQQQQQQQQQFAARPQTAQNTGSSSGGYSSRPQSYQAPASGQSPQHTGSSAAQRPSPQHTGSGYAGPLPNANPNAAGGYQAPYSQPPRPHSTYPAPSAPPSSSSQQPQYGPPSSQPPYADPTFTPGPPRPSTVAPTPVAAAAGIGMGAGAGAALAHSHSLAVHGNARPPAAPDSLRPGGSVSANRPNSSWSSYPAHGHGNPAERPTTPNLNMGYGPPPPSQQSSASLAPRPDVRPTTPSYAPPPPLSHNPSYGQYQPPSGPPPPNQPGYPSPPPTHLPSPDLGANAGPAFPYAPYQPHHQNSGPSPYAPPPVPPAGYPGAGAQYTGSPSPPMAFPGAAPNFPGPQAGYGQYNGGAGGFAPSPDPYGYGGQGQGQGQWGPPPPMPHRPGSQPYPGQPYPPQSGYGFPDPAMAGGTGSVGSGSSFGFATSSVDRVMGKKTREQLEGHVNKLDGHLNQLADSSAKLFSKFK
ncbi:hypothetical protein HMN09_01013200 [Mycena chlorophos]|uniref:Xylosidase/arabinosidase n=1 Tax=Mycena chlorophos TaxID=658473 RepID=A0A8H6W3H5_MYCCL|nr:hypothetical protein HMN09_01013200 [Mycena chlorophos]